jgi:hypothetical protein
MAADTAACPPACRLTTKKTAPRETALSHADFQFQRRTNMDGWVIQLRMTPVTVV